MKSTLHLLEFNSTQLKHPVLHSDTLFSAILKASEEYFGKEKTEELIQMFDNKDVEISSAFPSFSKDENKDIYLNFNLLSLLKDEKLKREKRKKLKSIWIPLSSITDLFSELIKDENKAIQPFIKEESEQKFYRGIQVRIQKSKEIQLYNIYTYYNLTLGFLSKGKDNELIELFENYLSSVGIGGDRSVGFGHFKYSHQQISLPEEGNAFLCLNLFYPTKEEWSSLVENLNSNFRFNYSLIKRSGWISNYQKPFVNFISETSLLPKISFSSNAVFDYDNFSLESLEYKPIFYRGGFPLWVNI